MISGWKMSDSGSDYESMRERIDLKELRVVDEVGDSGQEGNGLEFDTLSEASGSSGRGTAARRKRRERSHVTSHSRRERNYRHHRSRSPVRSVRRHKRPSLSDKFNSYEDRLEYLFRGARFFMIKSGNPENIALSKIKGVWSTLPINENKLNQAVKSTKNVILIFSVKESMKFCGFARLASESRRDTSPVKWVLPSNINPQDLDGVFKVDWICRKDLPFLETAHLKNAWNLNKPVKIGRDGQEIEPSVGKKLCLLFPKDHNIDMEKVLRRSRNHAIVNTMSSSSQEKRTRLQSSVVAAPPHSYNSQSFNSSQREYYPSGGMRYHTHPYYMVAPYDPPPPPRYYEGPPLPPDLSKHYIQYFYPHNRPLFPGRPLPPGFKSTTRR